MKVDPGRCPADSPSCLSQEMQIGAQASTAELMFTCTRRTALPPSNSKRERDSIDHIPTNYFLDPPRGSFEVAGAETDIDTHAPFTKLTGGRFVDAQPAFPVSEPRRMAHDTWQEINATQPGVNLRSFTNTTLAEMTKIKPTDSRAL